MAELQNKQRPQVAASACKIIDKSALSAQFPPPVLSACSSAPPSAGGGTGFQFLGDARRLHHPGQHGFHPFPRRPVNL